jgi:bifunctional DNA-binding transcriptional regulator/antitoxin component of YhaV-PrlF toxin-antitoxin module
MLVLPIPEPVAELLGIEEGDQVKFFPEKVEPQKSLPPLEVRDKTGEEIKIELTEAAIKWPHLPLKKDIRSLFPDDSVDFFLEFEGVVERVHVAANKIAIGKFKNLLKSHNFRPKSKVIIRVVKPWEEYKLVFPEKIVSQGENE